MNRLRSLLLAGIAIILAGAALGFAKSDPEAARRSARAKARHFFLSGAAYDAQGNTAAASELYKRAYEIDSTYREAALEYGLRRYGMPGDTLATPAERLKSRTIARKFIDAYPADIFPNLFYSNIMERSEELEEATAVMEGLLSHHPDNSDLLRMIADLYAGMQDYDKALEAMNAYERIEGPEFQQSINKAGLWLAKGDTLGALGEADRLVAANPRNPQFLLLKSQLQAYVNMPDSAMQTALKAEEIGGVGYDGVVQMQIAELYRSQGDSVNYDNRIYRALMADDLTFDAKKDVMTDYLGKLLQGNGDTSRGDKLFDVLLSQYPHEPELLFLAARYSVSKEDFEKASEEMEYALDMDQMKPDYWGLAMSCGIMRKDYEQVDEMYQRACKALGEELPMRLTVMAGMNATLADNPAKAIEYYSESLSENFPGQTLGEKIDIPKLGQYLTLQNLQDLIMLYQQAGDAYFANNDKEHAIVCYDNSITIDPDNALTLNNYAYFMVKDGRNFTPEELKKADEMSSRAIELDPGNPTYLDTRAWVLYQMGEYQEAKEVQMQALELMGDDETPEDMSELYNHLGDILLKNGQSAEALDAWKKALEGDPNNAELQDKIKHAPKSK